MLEIPFGLALAALHTPVVKRGLQSLGAGVLVRWWLDGEERKLDEEGGWCEELEKEKDRLYAKDNGIKSLKQARATRLAEYLMLHLPRRYEHLAQSPTDVFKMSMGPASGLPAELRDWAGDWWLPVCELPRFLLDFENMRLDMGVGQRAKALQRVAKRASIPYQELLDILDFPMPDMDRWRAISNKLKKRPGANQARS